MVNPDNVMILKGCVCKSPNIIREKETQKPIYIEFEIAIPRPYLNKGEQRYDYPLVKYDRKDFMNYSNLNEGDCVSIVGSYLSEYYTYNDKKIKRQFVAADCIKITSKTTKTNCEKRENNKLDLPLPY